RAECVRRSGWVHVDSDRGESTKAMTASPEIGRRPRASGTARRSAIERTRPSARPGCQHARGALASRRRSPPMPTPSIAMTGSTGRLGGRVARRLSELGVPQRLIVRDAGRAPTLPGAEVHVATYSDRAALARGLEGVRTLFFVSASESLERLTQHFA